jgi:hypothetical protein
LGKSIFTKEATTRGKEGAVTGSLENPSGSILGWQSTPSMYLRVAGDPGIYLRGAYVEVGGGGSRKNMFIVGVRWMAGGGDSTTMDDDLGEGGAMRLVQERHRPRATEAGG